MNDPTNPQEPLTEALHSAYPAGEPGEHLNDRLVHAERVRRVRAQKPSGFRKGWFAVLGGLALLSVVGFTAYKIFFDRPGEAAIALIPADADLVITLDTNPSAQQLPTFQKIGAALKQEGILEKLDDVLTAVLNQNPVARDIRPYVSQNMALALWMPAGGFDKGPEPDGAAFLALTNPGAVSDILDRNIPADQSLGFTVYNVDKTVYGAVINNYLVVGPNPEVLAKINRVAGGSEQSVANLAEYKSARGSLAPDSNVMVFVSPRALSHMDEGKGPNPFAGTRWMALGMALREHGLEFLYQCPMDESRLPGLQNLSSIKPIDPEILRKLPDGAYGVLVYSEAAKYWHMISDIAAQEPNGKKDMDKGIADFEKQTGLNIPRDIVPAFGGNLVLAVYPSPTMPGESFDGIFMLDDANGANPAELADKLRAFAESESAKQGEKMAFVSEKRGDATIWRLDKSSQAKLQLEIAPRDVSGVDASMQMPEGMEDMDSAEIEAAMEKQAAEREAKIEAASNKPREAPKAMSDKTIIYAQVGNSLVLASSEPMLTKALDALAGRGSSLADDTAFAGMQGRIRDGAQSMMMINVNRILETLRPHIEQGMANEKDGFGADDVISIFGRPDTGWVASGSYDGKVMTGEMFVPLNFVQLVRVIGQGMRQGGPGGPMNAPPIMAIPKNAGKIVRVSRVLAKL